VFRGEATNPSFGLIQSGIVPTIYLIRGEHTNHYDTDGYHVSIKGYLLHKNVLLSFWKDTLQVQIEM
jgi:hypothetical protein